VAAAGLGAFVFFAATGLSERAELRERCAPFCTDDDVAGMRTRFIAADVSLAIAAAAGTGAAILYLTRVRVTRDAFVVGAGARF
jgi:hypothetical protein